MPQFAHTQNEDDIQTHHMWLLWDYLGYMYTSTLIPVHPPVSTAHMVMIVLLYSVRPTCASLTECVDQSQYFNYQSRPHY